MAAPANPATVQQKTLTNFQRGAGANNYPVLKMIQKFKNRVEKRKAVKLFKILKKSTLKWNDKGEIVFKYKPVRGSNIIVLIKHALRNNNSKPLGLKYFYKALKHLFLPPDLIQNPLGKGLSGNRNSFRPPGNLVERINTKTL